MLHVIHVCRSHLILYGVNSSIYKIAESRGQDPQCTQEPRAVPHGSFHLKVDFVLNSENEETGIDITRIEAAFRPGEWTCVYGPSQDETGPERGATYFLTAVPSEVCECLKKSRNKVAMLRLMDDEALLDMRPEGSADNELEKVVSRDLNQIRNEERDDRANALCDQEP